MKASASAVLESMAEGAYARQNEVVTGATHTAGTEIVMKSLGSATNKVIVVYVTMKLRVWDGIAGEPIPYEYFVIRNDSVTPPDLNDTQVVENLMRDKKILARGSAFASDLYVGFPHVVKLKFFNVTLEEDEYMLFVLLPKMTSSAGEVSRWYEIEQRTLTLD